jgi:Uma2 family endonuclease
MYPRHRHVSAFPAFEPELFMTEAEYLAFEHAADTKHEFVDGRVYDWPGYEVTPQGLAGASRTHNRLQLRLVRSLGPLADAAGCDVFGSDMRLRVRLQRLGRPTRRYYYPDAMVVCDQELHPDEGDDELHVTRPCLVFEIPSRRSGRIDHTEKLEIYQSIASVQAYVIVHQQEQRVEYYSRMSEGAFGEAVQLGPDDRLPLPCLRADLPVAAIYAGASAR